MSLAFRAWLQTAKSFANLWIPAFAGMTAGGIRGDNRERKIALRARLFPPPFYAAYADDGAGGYAGGF